MAAPLRSTVRRSVPRSDTDRASTAPRLRAVPARRRVAGFAVTTTALIAVLMMGAVLLHTRIAERQLEIDRLDRDLQQAQADFDVLRAERAELRSPTRLAELAGELGMVPGSASEFVEIDPMVVARTIASTGVIPIGEQSTAELQTPIGLDLSPIEQFLLVKRASGVQP